MDGAGDATIFGFVLALRLVVPLLVFRFPLPSILASLVIDAVDQTVFQTFTDLDLTNYQSYDKALDIYYLALAYVSTMRNWAHMGAFEISRGLFYYRLVGVALFELTGAQYRTLLLVFPNTFEYFFIALSAVALLWRPLSVSTRSWLLTAAAIWIFVKLPQEWWIHVAQLDFTDAVRDHAWFAVAVVVAIIGGTAVLWFVVRPRLRPPDHALEIRSEDLPGGLERGEVRRAGWVARGRVLDLLLLEKFVLVTLITAIFASILPDVHASTLQITIAVGIVVTLDSAVGLAAARAGRGFDAAWASFLALAAVNLLLVLLASFALPGESRIDPPVTMFFLLLLTLVVSLFDRYAPVNALRRRTWEARTAA